MVEESEGWFRHLCQHINEEKVDHKVNWLSYYANWETGPTTKAHSTIIPLLQDEIATHGMVRHIMDIIKEVHRALHPNQLPVITADQPVYALGKKVQWLYPDIYGEDKGLMMMDPLPIEMAFLSLIGDWLESTGWSKLSSNQV